MLATDLHIHSGLSPCADNDMTPNNIVRMAKLKGLKVIGITDHNSTRNLQSFYKIAKRQGVFFVPGVEITTKEEVHMLAFFDNILKAEKFQEVLDDTLPKIKNKPEIFGNQYIYDEEDNIVGEFDVLLLSAIRLSIKETIDEVIRIGGIPIPAHIDRQSFSILSNLGFISQELNIKIIETTINCNYIELLQLHPYLARYKRIVSSDAHRLGDILESVSFKYPENENFNEIFTSLYTKGSLL